MAIRNVGKFFPRWFGRLKNLGKGSGGSSQLFLVNCAGWVRESKRVWVWDSTGKREFILRIGLGSKRAS